MRLTSFKSWGLVIWVLTGACSSQGVIPEPLEPLIDRTVSFQEIVEAPESYQGKVVVLGGEVLKAKRLKEGTQIELLHLPLNKHDAPILDRQQSQGRFLALQPEFLDPATIAEGTKLTIVGEVSGTKIEHLDDVEYRYPVVRVKHLYPWVRQPDDYVRPYPYPRFSIGIGGGTGGRIGGGGGFGIGF